MADYCRPRPPALLPRIKCPLFGGEKKFKWSDDNKHPTRPHSILKNTKIEERSPFFAFLFFSMVWGRVDMFGMCCGMLYGVSGYVWYVL